MTRTAVTIDSPVAQAEGVLYRNLDGEAVLVHLASGACFELDAIGTQVWEMIGGGETLANVVDALLADYGVDRAIAEQDLVALVNELAAHGLVRIGPKVSSNSESSAL